MRLLFNNNNNHNIVVPLKEAHEFIYIGNITYINSVCKSMIVGI